MGDDPYGEVDWAAGLEDLEAPPGVEAAMEPGAATPAKRPASARDPPRAAPAARPSGSQQPVGRLGALVRASAVAVAGMRELVSCEVGVSSYLYGLPRHRLANHT